MAKPIIYRRKAGTPFEAIQFTAEPGNIKDILTWLQSHNIGSFYRAPITPVIAVDPTLDTRNSIPAITLKAGVIEAIGYLYNSSYSDIRWIFVGDWITLDEHEHISVYSDYDEFHQYNEEVK